MIGGISSNQVYPVVIFSRFREDLPYQDLSDLKRLDPGVIERSEKSFGDRAEELHDLRLEHEEKVNKIRDEILVLKRNISFMSPQTAIVLIEHIKFLASQLQVEVSTLSALQLEIQLSLGFSRAGTSTAKGGVNVDSGLPVELKKSRVPEVVSTSGELRDKVPEVSTGVSTELKKARVSSTIRTESLSVASGEGSSLQFVKGEFAVVGSGVKLNVEAGHGSEFEKEYGVKGQRRPEQKVVEVKKGSEGDETQKVSNRVEKVIGVLEERFNDLSEEFSHLNRLSDIRTKILQF